MVVKRKNVARGTPLRAPKKARQADYETWLNRREAADLLGVSVNTIINWQEDRLRGAEVVRCDAGGAERLQWVFDPAELEKCRRRQVALRSREPGEVAARAFELFRDGKSNADVVMALRQTPDKVEYLREKWLDMGGSAIVISDTAHQAFEALVGPFKGVADLVELVAALKSQLEKV